jgi:ABC-type cobalamin/Fe3+-siderophores transport system ATPase subunit
MSATAGFLEHCAVEFAPGLTCVIGSRGTCKSTLLESIRFVFDKDPERVRSLIGVPQSGGDPWHGLIKETLGAGSIRCEVSSVVGNVETRHVLEREVGSDTRLFQDGVREHAERDILHNIEIFSQGDLQRIADDDNDEMRIALVDRPHAKRLATLREKRDKLAQELLQLGPNLRELRVQLSALRHEVQPAGALREQLRKLVEASPQLSPELEAERNQYNQRRQAVEQLRDMQHAYRSSLESSVELLSAGSKFRALSEEVLSNESVDSSDVSDAISRAVNAFNSLAAAAEVLKRLDLDGAVERQTQRYEQQNQTYYQLRQQQQDVNESLKQQQHLQRQIEYIERKQQELEAGLAQEAKLVRVRQDARAQVASIDDEIYQLRIQEIDAINEEHGDTVYLTLRSGSGAPRYVELLSGLLGGSRIRSQDEVAAALADTLTAAALIDLVEEEGGQRLADLLGRDLGQMNRVVAHLADHADLYSLEAMPPAARLDITLYDNGEPKPVETLSKGQKATALLPLILRPLPYPLLFDQPEDDLDNSFIFNTLVKTVQALRGQRQVIFVTHNANLPVLAGADHIIVMSMRTPSRAEMPLSGTVDERKQEILDLLEGGAEAFLRREESYGELLAGSVLLQQSDRQVVGLVDSSQ